MDECFDGCLTAFGEEFSGMGYLVWHFGSSGLLGSVILACGISDESCPIANLNIKYRRP